MDRNRNGDVAKNVLETFDRLLGAITYAVELAKLAETDDVREWVGLAALDAIDLGAQLGMLASDEAEWRRAEIRRAIDDLDRS